MPNVNASAAYKLRLDIPGNLDVQSGGKVDVTGRGHDTGYGPGVPSSTYNGGSYGGQGGRYSGQTGDGATLAWRVTNEITVERQVSRVEQQEERIAGLTDIVMATSIVAEKGDEGAIAELFELQSELAMKQGRLEVSRIEVEDELETLELSRSINGWFHLANTVLPKTSETISLLQRLLEKHAGLVTPVPDDDDMAMRFGEMVGRRDFEERFNAELDESHGATWILGTSLGFEALILGFGVWRFRRRDF